MISRGAFVYRLGHGPLKAERRVRFPYALPLIAGTYEEVQVNRIWDFSVFFDHCTVAGLIPTSASNDLRRFCDSGREMKNRPSPEQEFPSAFTLCEICERPDRFHCFHFRRDGHREGTHCASDPQPEPRPRPSVYQGQLRRENISYDSSVLLGRNSRFVLMAGLRR